MQVQNAMTVEAELNARLASAQLVRFHFEGRVDRITREPEAYRWDMCLTPRPGNARACYRDHWSLDRFERLGNIFVLPPNEAMRVRADCVKQASIVCHLRPEAINEWFDGAVEWTDPRLAASLDVSDANIRSLLLRLAEEARNPGFASGVLVELVAAQLAIEFARYCSAINERSASGSLAAWRLRLIDERLLEVRAAPTLSELASLCRLSVRQLTRGFRASRSCSIGDYVANSRVEHAKRMLGTDLSVKAVAYSLGFASPSGFCFAFRRATGETPRQFQQRVLRTAQ
jgi:AraC family transcriptional regulator